jgi:hypothetical protein
MIPISCILFFRFFIIPLRLTWLLLICLPGLGLLMVQATAIIGEGITDPEDLVTYTHSNIKTFFKHLSNQQLHPPFGLQHKFQMLHYWVEKRIPLGLSVNSELFTNVELVTWGEKMRLLLMIKMHRSQLLPHLEPTRKIPSGEYGRSSS